MLDLLLPFHYYLKVHFEYKYKCNSGLVSSNNELGSGFFLLTIDIGSIYFEPAPGQFINIYLNDEYGYMLPRPFSVFNIVKYENLGSAVQILYKVIGRGTKIISQLTKGDRVEFTGPLGNGFIIEGEKPLLIAGGVGIASLNFLARRFKENKIEPKVLIGVRDEMSYRAFNGIFNNLDIQFSIERGELDTIFKGNVIELYSISDIDYDVIYICGPTNMLKSFEEIYRSKNIITKVYCCLESRMACGVGACLGCSIPTKDGYRSCCVDGPVFEIGEVIWKDLI